MIPNEPLRAVDANVLLRYFLNDVPAQAVQARRLIDSPRRIGVTAVVLAETAWTLAGPILRHPRVSVAQLLIDLLARDNIVPVGFDKAEAQAALMSCTARTGATTFGDALIAASARSAGVYEIYTFDRQFARSGLTPVALP